MGGPMHHWIGRISFATALAIITGAATTYAGPCKGSGVECSTTASCCRGLLCVNSNPPGKRPKGVCRAPTTTSSSTTTITTTTTSTTTTTLCLPQPPNCAGEGCNHVVQDNCGNPFNCIADCSCQFTCFPLNETFGDNTIDCGNCLAECVDECGAFC